VEVNAGQIPKKNTNGTVMEIASVLQNNAMGNAKRRMTLSAKWNMGILTVIMRIFLRNTNTSVLIKTIPTFGIAGENVKTGAYHAMEVAMKNTLCAITVTYGVLTVAKTM